MGPEHSVGRATALCLFQAVETWGCIDFRHLQTAQVYSAERNGEAFPQGNLDFSSDLSSGEAWLFPHRQQPYPSYVSSGWVVHCSDEVSTELLQYIALKEHKLQHFRGYY